MSVEEAFSRFIFDGALGSWVSWYLTAAALRESADVLYASLPPDTLAPLPPDNGWVRASVDTGRRNVYVLLVALAFENLLKGEIVRRDPQAVSGGRIGEALKTRPNHDLLKLAQSAKFAILPEEEQALSDAIDARRSWGAYPAGTTHKGNMGPPPGFDLVAFKRVFDDLCERLEASLTQGVGAHG